MPVVNFIPSNGRITIRCDPNTSKIVRVYFVVDKLAQAVLVHVDTASLAVMDFTLNYSGVCARFYLETGYAVVMDVICLKITLGQKSN